MEKNGNIATHKMKTFRCNLRPVRLVIFVCQLGLILRTEAQVPGKCVGHETYRPPETKDITVICGTEYIDLIILLCPVYHTFSNESLMVINNEYDKSQCYGVADWTADPPVLKFKIYLEDSFLHSCNIIPQIIDHIESGLFASFSDLHMLSISGIVSSVMPSAEMSSHHQPLLHQFSCRYPLPDASLTIRDNNRTIISTLSVHLYKDFLYHEKLIIPKAGLPPRTKIFVAVEAANLTDRYNVLLDRCYVTTSPDPKQRTYYDLFVGCKRADHVAMILNGMSQTAYFYFEAIRFVKHKNEAVYTLYLHCVTRLCEVSHCGSLLPDCSFHHHHHHLSKREAQYVSESTTVTSPAILIHKRSDDVTDGLSATDEPFYYYGDTDMPYYTEDGYKKDPPYYSLFDGSPTSSLNCYSIPVVVAIICNVILTICLSV